MWNIDHQLSTCIIIQHWITSLLYSVYCIEITKETGLVTGPRKRKTTTSINISVCR